ncbi:MAG: AHH domain-containing protein [Oscillospiraceae bacterium]|nr:AHH domain-containing protein [Oscillospiraceae bacterium]
MGINMFCYCGNSPVSNADRDGREREYLRTINGYYGGGYSATSVAAIVTVIVAPLVAEAKTAVSNITQAIRKHAKKLSDTSKSIYDDSQPRIHHIVPQGDFTNRSKPTQEAVAGMHEILKSVEMDVNHPLNLAVISQGYHKSLHTDAYLQNLYMQLQPHKGSKKGVCAVLISQQIIHSAGDPYKYSYWLS